MKFLLAKKKFGVHAFHFKCFQNNPIVKLQEFTNPPPPPPNFESLPYRGEVVVSVFFAKMRGER